VEKNSKNALADNCQYWIGESRFAQGKFYQAIAEFTKVFAFEDGDKQDDAQLMLGMAFMKLGDINSARVEFDWLVSCYSSSEYGKQAGAYLGQL
jgi:TolA-binding protein